MKLTELLLNRFLYKESLQNIETKDSSYNAGNVIEAEVPAIASGGAAQDINTSNVTINGAQLTPGTFPVTILDVSNWGWGQTCVFSSTDLDTVAWTLGIFKSADGTSYNIIAGATGNMAAKTYIYLDLLTSTTVYQTTTTAATAVGVGKVLIAVAQNATAGNLATYNLSEATQIVGDNILANSINASKIVTGQLIVGTNVALGTAFASASAGNLATLDQIGTAQLDSTVIVGGYIKTSLIEAGTIVAGSVAAEDITGTTITGKTLQTSSSGIRTVIDSSDDKLKFMSGNTVWAFIEPQAFGTLNGLYIASGAEDAWIRVVEGAHHLVSMRNSDGAYVSVYDDSVQLNATDISINGDLSTDDIYAKSKIYYSYAGNVVSGSLGGGTAIGNMTLDNSSTGIFKITHGLGTGNYTVVVTLRYSTATLVHVLSAHTSSYFTIRIGTVGGTLTDAAFDFVVFLWG